MKKNKMMRIASVLLVMTLISTCAISGTFAKYVKKVRGEDSARVAKWGVVLTVSAGEAFATQYETHDDTYEGEYSVIAFNAEDKLVAPGTSSKDKDVDGDLVATVMGTPEVATRYTLKIEGLKDVLLPKKNGLTDYTELKLVDGEYAYGTFDNSADYTPVKWNLTVSNSNGKTVDLVTVAKQVNPNFNGIGFSFTEAKALVNNQNAMNTLLPILEGMASGASNAQVVVNDDGSIEISMDFDPNTEMDYTFTLSWAWDFDDDGAGTYDKQDTLLGNIAAGVATVEGASTEIAAKLTATATQID